MDYRHTFPILKNDEIIQCMQELNISFTIDDLMKPNADHINKVYENFVDLLMGVTRDEAENPNFNVVEMLENPELHTNALDELSFFRTILKFMRVVGIHDFSMKDYLRPTTDRVKKILSAVINFAKFREEQLSNFEKYVVETDQLLERKANLEQENQDITDRLNAARQQRAEQEPTIKQMEMEVSSLTNELNKLNKEQQNMQKDFHQLKTLNANLTEKLANQKTFLANLKQECKKLSSQVVESPEKLKQLLIDLEVNLTNEREALNNLEKKSRELQLKMDSLTQVEQDIEKCMKFMEECEVEMRKLEHAQSDLYTTQESLSKAKINQKEMLMKEQQLKWQISSVQEKVVRLQKQQETKRTTFIARLESLEKEHSIVSSERSAMMERIREISLQSKEIEDKMFDLVHSHQIEMDEMRSHFLALRKQVANYHIHLSQALMAN